MDKNNITLRSYYNIVWKNKIKIFWVCFAVGIISIVISLFLPKWYKSTAVILSPSSSSGGLAGLGGLANLGIGNLLGDNESIFKYMAILKSRGLKEKVINKFNLMEKYESENMDQCVKKLEKYFYYKVGDEFQISITIIDKDQDLVSDMTNYVVKTLDGMNVDLSTQKAKNDRINIEIRYNQLIDSLKTLSTEMSQFMISNNIINLENQVIVGVENAASLLSQIILSETEYEVLKNTVSKSSSLLDAKKIQINKFKKEYDKLINTNSNYIPKFSEIPTLGVVLTEYEQKITYITRLLEFVGPQYEKFKLDEIKETPTIQVLDYGHRPDRKFKPKRSIIVLLSTFVAGFIMASYFILKEE